MKKIALELDTMDDAWQLPHKQMAFLGRAALRLHRSNLSEKEIDYILKHAVSEEVAQYIKKCCQLLKELDL